MLDTRDMNAVFQALASDSRRRMLDIVKSSPGIGVGALASQFDVSRIGVIKHLTVLEGAGLIVSERDGRTRRLYFNAVPIQMIYDRWTSEYSAYFSGQIARIKYRAEARADSSRNASQLHKSKGKSRK